MVLFCFCIVDQNIYILKKSCSFELSIHKRIWENINTNQKCFLSSKSAYKNRINYILTDIHQQLF